MTRLRLTVGITVLSLMAVLHPIRAAAQSTIPPLVQISGDLVDQKSKALSGSRNRHKFGVRGVTQSSGVNSGRRV